jgi:hypothetical protein
MSTRRYEILLPTRYNDGTPVEPEKDAESNAENRAFFREFKDRLKTRFRQIDLWIISYEIKIL